MNHLVNNLAIAITKQINDELVRTFFRRDGAQSPTLWLHAKTNTLRIIWPDGSVEFINIIHMIHKSWVISALLPSYIETTHYYCGPLFVSKENEP